MAVSWVSHVLCCRHGGDDTDYIRRGDCWWKAKEGIRVEDFDWAACFGGVDTVHCYGSGGEFIALLVVAFQMMADVAGMGEIFNLS